MSFKNEKEELEFFISILDGVGCSINHGTVTHASFKNATGLEAIFAVRSKEFIEDYKRQIKTMTDVDPREFYNIKFYPWMESLILKDIPAYIYAIHSSSLGAVLGYKLYNVVNSKVFFYDMLEEGFNYELPHKVFQILSQKEKREYISFYSNPAQLVFDPLSKRGVVSTPSETGKMYYEINAYLPPEWREEYSEKEPTSFLEFIEHFIPSSEDRKYTYNWIYCMLTSRNQTILYMQSDQGTGKNIFGSILGNLVGTGNHGLAREDLPVARFNNIVENKQLLILDEFSCITNDAKNGLKRFTNETIPIEVKYGDAKTIVNKCNFVIFCNSKKQVWVEPDDRRMSVVSITNKRLNQVWSDKKINSFLEKIKEPEYLASIYGYIKKNTSNAFSEAVPYQNEAFWEIVYESARHHIKHMVDTLLKGNVVYVDEMRGRYERRKIQSSKFPTDNEILMFFEKYKHGGQQILCEPNWDEGVLSLIPLKGDQSDAEFL